MLSLVLIYKDKVGVVGVLEEKHLVLQNKINIKLVYFSLIRIYVLVYKRNCIEENRLDGEQWLK